MFSPYELEVILWYHSRCEDWQDMSVPIWRGVANKLIGLGLLEIVTANDTQYYANNMSYKPTEKLHVYVDGLCNLNLPVQKWVIERTNNA